MNAPHPPFSAGPEGGRSRPRFRLPDQSEWTFELIEQINEALGLLADGGHTYGTPESVGLDPEYRSDARAPDDTDDRPL